MRDTAQKYLNLKYIESGMSYQQITARIDDLHPDCSMSDTKLSNILTKPGYKLSIDDMFAVVDALKLDRTEILAILGEQEYRAAEQVDYKGTIALVADFERRETEIRSDHAVQLAKATEIRQGLERTLAEVREAFKLAITALQDNRTAELAKRDEIQHSVVSHLQQQVLDLNQRAASLDKSIKWWRATAIVCISLLCLVVGYVVWELLTPGRGLTAFFTDLVRNGIL